MVTHTLIHTYTHTHTHTSYPPDCPCHRCSVNPLCPVCVSEHREKGLSNVKAHVYFWLRQSDNAGACQHCSFEYTTLAHFSPYYILKDFLSNSSLSCCCQMGLTLHIHTSKSSPLSSLPPSQSSDTLQWLAVLLDYSKGRVLLGLEPTQT